jgi:uncharacterized membrane protein YbhN (UPF0104 family)
MQASKKLLFWARVFFAVASLTGLAFIIFKIQGQALAPTFRRLEGGSFLLALLAFGFLFVPAGIRWHLAMRANGPPVRLGAALRISLIGHFFYTILFGAAGGDAAKSMLYSRWYHLPVTKTLAASSLDRLLGLVGMILFMLMAFGFAYSQGGFEKLGRFSMRWPIWWLLALAIGLTVLVLWLKRSSPDAPQMRYARNVRDSGLKLSRSPKRLLVGVACGVAVQAALSSVLALCLAAASPEPLPWWKMAWTFPVISIVSALPITFAGLGVRDGAAAVLFGLYGIPASSALGASLLTAAVSLIWAVAGAGLLWREALRREPHGQLRSILAAVPR